MAALGAHSIPFQKLLRLVFVNLHGFRVAEQDRAAQLAGEWGTSSPSARPMCGMKYQDPRPGIVLPCIALFCGLAFMVASMLGEITPSPNPESGGDETTATTPFPADDAPAANGLRPRKETVSAAFPIGLSNEYFAPFGHGYSPYGAEHSTPPR